MADVSKEAEQVGGVLNAYLAELNELKAQLATAQAQVERLKLQCEAESVTYQDNLTEIQMLKHERDRLRGALNDLFSMMEEGLIVRNTQQDSSPEWAMRSLKFVQRLAIAKAALEET